MKLVNEFAIQLYIAIIFRQMLTSHERKLLLNFHVEIELALVAMFTNII